MNVVTGRRSGPIDPEASRVFIVDPDQVAFFTAAQVGADVGEACVGEEVCGAHGILIRGDAEDWCVEVDKAVVDVGIAVEKHVVAGDFGASGDAPLNAADVDTNWGIGDDILVLIEGVEVVCVEVVFTHREGRFSVRDGELTLPGLAQYLAVEDDGLRRCGEGGEEYGEGSEAVH